MTNEEKYKSKLRDYYVKNKERIKAYNREWKKKNRDYINAKDRERYVPKSLNAEAEADEWERRKMRRWHKQGRLNKYGYLSLKAISLIAVLLVKVNAANLIKPRFAIEHSHPIRITKISDLAGHMRESHNGLAHLSLGDLVGTISEIKYHFYAEITSLTVQWHPDRKLFSIRKDNIDDIALIDPKEHGMLSKVHAWKAGRIAGYSVLDILRAFD